MRKAYEIGPQNGLRSLRAVERPLPVPGPGEALLRLRAACLNHRDLLVLQGCYGPLRPERRIPLSDGVGEVIALGEHCGDLQLGQRVICPHFASWIDGDFDPSVFAADLGTSLDGWATEAVLVPAAALVLVPDALSDAQAAPLCAAGLTAWHALVEVGRLKAGDLVLTLGTGGVSILALQLAKLKGARVAITSSSDAKLAQARELGAELTVNYRTHPDWAAELLRLSKGQGADVILETGGLATLPASIDAAAPNARIAIIGGLGGRRATRLPNFTTLVLKNLTVKGITSGSRAMLVELVQAAAAHDLKPVIDCEFGFDDLAAAYAHLRSAKHFGKVLVRGR